MKKKVALLLVGLCFASMIFVGCSSNDSSDAEVETEAVVTETTTEEKAEEETTEEVTEATTEETTTEEASDSEIDPDFKQAMDSYEAFFDDYCEFMTKYAESDGTDLEMLADYADYLSKYDEYMEDIDAIDEDDLNDAELAYYIDVTARVEKKLLEVAY